jgi:hypothetical protein
MTLRKNPQRGTNDSFWNRVRSSFGEDLMSSSVVVWEISISGINEEEPFGGGPSQVKSHKADVHWPVPTHVPETLLPSHFGTVLSELGTYRVLQRNCAGDGEHLTAYLDDSRSLRNAPEDTFWLLWNKPSYRWRCRLWFIWREHVRDVWDFLKKPMLIAALVAYPLVHVLAAAGVIGCDCPPVP